MQQPKNEVQERTEKLVEKAKAIFDQIPEGSEYAYVKRMEAEMTELTDRIVKLAAFCGSARFSTVIEGKRNMMAHQLHHMNNYLTVLSMRFDRELDEIKGAQGA